MKKKRFVDLSISIEPDLPSDPPMMIPEIRYVDHSEGAEQMKDFFPGVTTEQLPGGLGWALEYITLTTHSGTHLDAPYHYHPTMNNGEPSLTIDEIPLEWCFNDGVVLDFRRKGNGERISVDDLKNAIDGCHKNQHNQGDNDRGKKYLNLELIVRDSAHVNQYLQDFQNCKEVKTPYHEIKTNEEDKVESKFSLEQLKKLIKENK